MKSFFAFLVLFVLSISIVFGQDSDMAMDDEMSHMTLQFAAVVGDEMLMCGQDYTIENSGVDSFEVADFRFFVTGIHLITSDGEEVPFMLMQEDQWQQGNVVLLDFENGEGRCEIGNSAINATVSGMVAEGDYVGIKFNMGVPFELNHQDTTMADAPLNIAAMWWNWQIGYKFARIDLLTSNTDLAAYNIHLGSTGCTSPASVIAPDEPCSRPNIVEVAFDEFDFENEVIVADLAGFLSGIDLSENTPQPPGCQSGFDDPECTAVFASFGLDLETGLCADDSCATQNFFTVRDISEVPIPEDVEMDLGMEMDMGGSEDHDGHGN